MIVNSQALSVIIQQLLNFSRYIFLCCVRLLNEGDLSRGKSGSFFRGLLYMIFFRLVYYSAWAAVTEFHRLSCLNNRTVFPCSAGGWKSQIKELAGLGPSMASLPGLQMAALWLCPHMVVRLCVLTWYPSLCIRTPVILD